MDKEEQKRLLTEIMEDDAKDGIYHTGDTNKMVTAVEWFYQRILAEDIKSVFEQAKVIEKNEIMAAYMRGSADTNRLINLNIVTLAEQYYNETYNK